MNKRKRELARHARRHGMRLLEASPLRNNRDVEVAKIALEELMRVMLLEGTKIGMTVEVNSSVCVIAEKL